jgi:hypothetical protein
VEHVDWGADPDWEWHSAASDSPEQLMALGQDADRIRESVEGLVGENPV